MMQSGDVVIKAYEERIEKYGFCPYMSVGKVQIPCTDKCALYVHYGYDEDKINGCSHKSIAVDLHRLAEEFTSDE